MNSPKDARKCLTHAGASAYLAGMPFEEVRDAVSAGYIAKAVAIEGSQTAAAKTCRIHRNTIMRALKKARQQEPK